MGSALKFRQTNVPKQNGEQARVKVVQGPDYGNVFVIMGNGASVGRGEENDIVISDLKASRQHALLQLFGSAWIVKDAGSANGILVNGQPVREAKLKIKDTIKLGETTLEFVAAEAGTMMLISPPRDIQEIRAEEAAFEAQKRRVRGLVNGVGAAAGGNRKWLYIGGAILLAVLLLDEDAKSPKEKKNKEGELVRDLASLLPKADDGVVNKTAEMFFRGGFREYRERNYLRARSQFETVLQIAPGHRLATLYLENCTREIEQEVKDHLHLGKRSLNAGKLKDARGHFESVLRLLHRDQSNADYVEAKEQIEQVHKTLKGGAQ